MEITSSSWLCFGFKSFVTHEDMLLSVCWGGGGQFGEVATTEDNTRACSLNTTAVKCTLMDNSASSLPL